MSKCLTPLFKVFYVSIFLHFARKIITKTRIMFDDCVPIVNEDGNDWFAVRLFHRYFIYDNLSKQYAKQVATRFYNEIPVLRGHIEVVEHEDAEVTLLEEIPGLTAETIDSIAKIWSQMDDDD